MMNTETKRHIDNARKVLVGVVPNPISQIDQITNALIYKFMDDMDEEAIKAGGEPSFFVDDLAQYSWTRLMDPALGNNERLNLYSEALTKFSQAKQLPELFRDIFKAAFLPYRSPETLGLFLKEVSHFNYSHPEELGNAYEYLLSIMSSQGDAGQFRTPRHIIDFIVSVVNPTKDDKVLDPACGTGGFLVSAYRHILNQHTVQNALTPAERKKLMNNFEGYDIDPSMVRMAQVNMYLHQFKNPRIYNYDTLTSDNRWNDTFDVILANPPFMSPKGGIKPHNKFGLSSSRSEVLFVDYIMNHLRPRGRAGIIVPDGVIFRPGTEYKTLRKNLLETGLYAVVSLPSGVFQPYSGVNTSILLFDPERAKKSTELLFMKIENDGFDLGAQRRPIDKNDLLKAVEILKAWQMGEKVDDKAALYVEKSKIAESGDYYLIGDRYRIAQTDNSKFNPIELGKLLVEKSTRVGNPADANIQVWSVSNKQGFIVSNEYFDKQVASADISNYKIIGPSDFAYNPSRINVGSIALNYTSNIGAVSPMYTVFSIKNNDMISNQYMYSVLKSEKIREYILHLSQGTVRQQLRFDDLKLIQIPLPPLEVQNQIVAELHGYAGIISSARKIVENWKPKIDIDPTWPMVKLGGVCDNFQYGSSKKSSLEGEIPCLRMGNIQNGEIDWTDLKYATPDEEFEKYFLSDGDVLFNRTNSPALVGKTAIFRGKKPAVFAGYLIRILYYKDKLLGDYLNYCLNSESAKEYFQQVKTDGVSQSNINAQLLSRLEIPLPPLELQKQIIEKIESERILVESTKKLISIYEQKSKEVIAKLWNE